MSGGHLDMLSYVNDNISKYNEKYNQNKPYAIGFEVDKKGKDHIRFFDNDGKTVWLPDDMYSKLNDIMMKDKFYRITYVSEYWKQIASGHYTSVNLMMRQKFKALKKQVVAKFRDMFNHKR